MTIRRTVYATRETQKQEIVPLDARLGLPEGEFSALLEDWAQAMCVENSWLDDERVECQACRTVYEPGDRERDRALEMIARDVLDIPTLETRNSDRLDFHDVGVAGLRKAHGPVASGLDSARVS